MCSCARTYCDEVQGGAQEKNEVTVITDRSEESSSGDAIVALARDSRFSVKTMACYQPRSGVGIRCLDVVDDVDLGVSNHPGLLGFLHFFVLFADSNLIFPSMEFFGPYSHDHFVVVASLSRSQLGCGSFNDLVVEVLLKSCWCSSVSSQSSE